MDLAAESSLCRRFMFELLFISTGIVPSYSQLNPPPPDVLGSFNTVASTISASAVAGIVISGLVAVGVVIAVIYCLCIVQKRANDGISFPSIQIGNQPPRPASTLNLGAGTDRFQDNSLPARINTFQFTFDEVIEITNNLRVKLGEGGFGPVYFGKLKDGKAVAVKRLSLASHQGAAEFLNEVDILSHIHHKNLVSLIGYCSESDERILIYEFMPKGTLEEHLHGLASEQEPLDWLIRLKIAVGAAQGFVYLHYHCDPAIIHRDVKSSNILLDSNFNAKVADFGLSKLVSTFLTHVTTGVKGTIGYLDPEYAETQWLTEKSDVYSFGIILLELITGSEVVIQTEGDYTHIVQWARPYIENKTIQHILDKNIAGISSLEMVQKVADIALKCAAYQSIHRPSFNQILQVLEETLRVEMIKWKNYDPMEDSEMGLTFRDSVSQNATAPLLQNATAPLLHMTSHDRHERQLKRNTS